MNWAGQVALLDLEAILKAGVGIETIVRQHARFVFRVAFSVLRNREDAEDAVQETFLRLSRQRDLTEIRDVRLWLARVSWRLALDRLRKHREQSSEQMPGFMDRIADETPDAEQLLIERQMKELLERMIGGLPRDLREVVRLNTVQEMSSADVAQVLGIPEGSVRQRLFRARQMLRQKLLAAMEKKS